MSSLEVAGLIRDIANKYEFYSNILLLFIAMIGNVSIILIFTTLRIFRGNRSAYYLAIESTTNIGLFLAVSPSDIVGYIWGQDPTELSIIWCKIQTMIAHAFGLYSLFIICFLALDQYLSTNHRPSWRQIATLKLAHYLTFFNISIVLSQGILLLVSAKIGSIGCSIYDPIAKIYFAYFYYPMISGILPLGTSSLFSLLAYRNVRRIIRRQIPLARRRLDQQMTAIALARVLCIVILGVPFIIFSLFNLNMSYSNDDYIKIAIFNFLSVIIYSLLNINFAVS